MEHSADDIPLGAAPRMWQAARVAVVLLGAVSFAWNVLWLAQFVLASNVLDTSKPLGTPFPIIEPIVVTFGAFLGLLGGLFALVSRPDGSRMYGVILAGAALLAIAGLAVGEPWNTWTFTGATWFL